MEEIEYPVRINRYLFLKRFCSRREADRLIDKGLIKINGKKATLGQKVNAKDKVEINEKIQGMSEKYEYVAFHKPRGVVSHNPLEGEKSIEDIYKSKVRLSPIGRLDKDSEGLIILTNDGRIIDGLLNPKYDHEKEYVVRLDKNIKPSFKNKMERGVNIEGYITKPAKVRVGEGKSFRIKLTEGKKHQIRRMCAALGYQVKSLKRVSFGPISIRGILNGHGRKLRPDEKFKLLKLAKMND